MSALVGVNRLLHSCRTVTYNNYIVSVSSRAHCYAVRCSCRGTVRFWYGTIKVRWWCSGGTLLVRSRYVTVEVRSWYGRGTLLVRSSYVPGTVEVCSWYGSEVCSWYGRGMVRSRYAPGTVLVRSRYGRGTLLVRSRYDTIDAPGTVEVRSWYG